MFSGGAQRHALPRLQSEEMEILYISFPRVEIEPTTCLVNSHTFTPLTASELACLNILVFNIRNRYDLRPILITYLEIG